MYKTITQGVPSKVKLIEPTELREMDTNDIVIVNRIRLNSKLVEFEVRQVNKSETIVIRKAITTMKNRERKSRRAIMGAEMRVGDILRIFPEYESLPKNSFAMVTE